MNSSLNSKEVDKKVINTMKKVEILYSISKYLIKYRKDKHLTQKEMAKILDMDQSMIAKLESGTYNPTFKKLFDITTKLTNNSDMYIDILEEIQYNVKLVDSVSKEFYIFNSKINDLNEIQNCYKEFEKTYNDNKKAINIYMTYNIEEWRTINDKIEVSNA